MAMEPRSEPGILEAMRIDVARLHATWMELFFPRQLNPSPVLGKWTPDSAGEKFTYYGWAVIGGLLLLPGYPLLLLGFATRFHARRLDSLGARLGVIGVILLSVVIWGALTAFARYRFSFDGFVAVLAASVVATVAAVFAVVFSRVGGRGTTVLLAYPSGMTAVFLPPVVAALYSPTVAAYIFPRSQTLAIWLLDNVLYVGGLNVLLTRYFDLQGLAYVAMWFAIAVPLGWVLGFLVTVADLVRPRSESESGDDEGDSEN